MAGPIKRCQEFDRQVRERPRFQPALFLEGAELIALRLFKEVVLADSLLPVADRVFADPAAASPPDAWAGLLAFSFQIYLDFSRLADRPELWSDPGHLNRHGALAFAGPLAAAVMPLLGP